jgi:glycosyltransferase involved in cell wall biosynthesis
MQISRSGIGSDPGQRHSPEPGGRRHSGSGAAKRMFICDPICVLPFGHNAPAMAYFRSFFAPDFDRIECCVGLPFSDAIASRQGFRKYFTYLYNDVMPVDAGGGLDEGAGTDTDGPWPNDVASRIARHDYLGLITQEAMGRRDVLFLPSADFHSVHGLLEALRELPADESPAVLLRLIGVMENASHVVLEPMKHLCSAIEAARRAGHRILVAAETPVYANHLAASFDIDVAMLPYPLLAEAIPLPRTGPFVVASAGSARFDKGFLDLLPIIREVRRLDDGLDIEFRIQGLTDRQVVHHQSYTNQLYAMPGVVLLPAVLSHDDMRALYAGCHAVLLPYEQSIYQFRGSAVLMEAIAYGRHTIARGSLGFSCQIEYYQNGEICSTNEAFARAVIAASRLPREVMQRRLTLARSRYEHDTASAYRVWMEQSDA